MLCANGWVASVVQQVGRIHAAAFSDANLYAEVANKAFFWMQPSFYNIDITCLHKDAAAAYFTQVCSVAYKPPLTVHHLLLVHLCFQARTSEEGQLAPCLRLSGPRSNKVTQPSTPTPPQD